MGCVSTNRDELVAALRDFSTWPQALFPDGSLALHRLVPICVMGGSSRFFSAQPTVWGEFLIRAAPLPILLGSGVARTELFDLQSGPIHRLIERLAGNPHRGRDPGDRPAVNL